MHARHYQDWPNTVWNFSNPIRTDHVHLMITDQDGHSLITEKTEITRHRIKLTFSEAMIGSALITDCMDEV
jgi:hypothetical protein